MFTNVHSSTACSGQRGRRYRRPPAEGGQRAVLCLSSGVLLGRGNGALTQAVHTTQADLGRITKLEVQWSMISNYTAKLQFSEDYGTDTKTDTQVNETEQKAQK